MKMTQQQGACCLLIGCGQSNQHIIVGIGNERPGIVPTSE